MNPSPTRTKPARSYVFPVEVVAEADGRWSAFCPSINGCTSWGRTREEALASIGEVVRVCLEERASRGIALPAEAQTVNASEVVVVRV
ncbi:MAG: type II toxin-antitoxin system HicB family antitoxin [Polyangiales bacterium]